MFGARLPSTTGLLAAGSLAEAIAALGIQIVSGLTRGIDTAAHRAVLATGGHTVAVLGCGIDLIYPPENARLYGVMAQQGTLLADTRRGANPGPGISPGTTVSAAA